MATNNHLAPLRTPHALTPSSRPTAMAPPPPPTTTPNRRAISVDPTGTITASGRRPPSSLSASARRRGVFNTTTAAATPHAKAAFRSLDQRRAAIFNTPGRRRLSGLRDARGRETPRDVLRDLSRALAPATAVIASSSSSGSGGLTSSSSPGSGGGGGGNGNGRRRSRHRKSRRSGDTTLGTLDGFDDDDDDFPIERPRFSLPGIGDDFDDDDADLKPPRLSGLEDMDYTAQSIEMPRRAWSEGPLSGRLDRGSMGSVRFSDYAGPELLSDAGADIDSGFFPPPGLDDDDDDDMVMDEQAMVERFDVDEARRQTVGGESDFGPIEIPEEGNETTFVMAPVESPVRDPTMFDEGGFDDELPPGVGDDDDDDDDVNLDESAATAGLLGLVDDNDDNGLAAADETTIHSRTADLTSQLTSRPPRRKKAGKKISKHGIEYPSLPQGVVKRLATTFAKTAGVSKAKISADTLDAIIQATDWFFEQLADDLQAYAKHAGRKTIDESDMITLMRRQRQTSASTTPFALAQRHLPRELLQELRMPVPAPTKAPRKKAGRIEVDDEEDAT
ncbi:hypothetical protein SLS62_001488 [Diatrype stigma]|uniref:CENP-T/Histone H4 histone fold domain-containing protein n=1 Tax=Diatrype stigma TaxID=117547 RepID=A0AAN9YTN0_9PEZI